MIYEITEFRQGRGLSKRSRLCYVDNLKQARKILANFLERGEDDIEVKLNTYYTYRYNPSFMYIVEEFE